MITSSYNLKLCGALCASFFSFPSAASEVEIIKITGKGCAYIGMWDKDKLVFQNKK
jgi:hypothetical protein